METPIVKFSIIMKHLVYVLIAIFMFCFTANSSFGQDDAFKRKSKKGPNIYSPKRSRTKNKSKRYQNSISKKKSRRKNAIFSSKKKRYGATVGNGKGNSHKNNNGGSSGGRKSTKGRKKEK